MRIKGIGEVIFLPAGPLMVGRQFYTVAINILSNVRLSIGAVHAGRIVVSTIMSKLGT